MIVIFSQQEDVSTDYVIAWLRNKKATFLRLNEDRSNVFTGIHIKNGHIHIIFDDSSIDFNDINSIWYRRGHLNYTSTFTSKKDKIITDQIKEYLDAEIKQINYFIYQLFDTKYCVNRPDKYNTNKLESLVMADNAKLKIPETLISNNYKLLSEFSNDPKNELISKALCNNISIKIDGKTYGAGTISVNADYPHFFYSLFQKRISRFCEIRTYFIEDNYFSMAIFVDQSLTDARSLTLGNKRARLTPFNLPQDIKNKLKKISNMKNINSGSIDMILTTTGDFVFLELNPVGQYGHLEYACNYNISETIANILINENK